jgi:hypothetical protein
MAMVWKLLAIAMCSLSICAFAAALALSSSYLRSRPPRQDLMAGRTYLVEWHGQKAYLTRAENNKLNVLFLASGLFMGGYLTLYRFKHPFGPKPRPVRDIKL